MPKRMISTDISLSENLESCKEWTQLIFTWMIPHLDDWGRMVGNPAKFKAKVKPLSKRTPAQFEKAIREMAEKGLICWYGGEDEYYIAVKPESFDEQQTGIHDLAVKRGRRSRYPCPPMAAYRWPEDSENKDSRRLSATVAENLLEPNLTQPNLTFTKSHTRRTDGENGTKPDKESQQKKNAVDKAFKEGFRQSFGREPETAREDYVLLTSRLRKHSLDEILAIVQYAVSGQDRRFNEEPPSLSTILGKYHWNRIGGILGRQSRLNPVSTSIDTERLRAVMLIQKSVKRGEWEKARPDWRERMLAQAGAANVEEAMAVPESEWQR